jgi:hypothetical protein
MLFYLIVVRKKLMNTKNIQIFIILLYNILNNTTKNYYQIIYIYIKVLNTSYIYIYIYVF